MKCLRPSCQSEDIFRYESNVDEKVRDYHLVKCKKCGLVFHELDMFVEIREELARADAKHGHMLEPVEGLYTLSCEVMELAREVNRKNQDPVARRKEAVQVAAMAIKFLRDCC